MHRTARKIIEAELNSAIQANNLKAIDKWCIVLKAFDENLTDYDTADQERIGSESELNIVNNETVIDSALTSKIKIEDVTVDSEKAKDIIAILNTELGQDAYKIVFNKNNLTDQYEALVSVSPQEAPDIITVLEDFGPILA